jgi:hypothetical protein
MKINKNDPRMIPSKDIKIFTKYNWEIFNRMYPCYGGHHWWICKYIFLDYLDYLNIGFHKYDNKIKKLIDINHMYYDGYHHSITIFKIFYIAWGGYPFKDKYI